MKTIKFFLISYLLVLAGVCSAQLKVDSLGRIYIGKAPDRNGFYIIDNAPSYGAISSFAIRRTGSTVSLGRSYSAGLQFGLVTGTVAVGNRLSAAKLNTYTGLQVCQYGYGGGIDLVYASSSGYTAHRIEVDATSAYPLALYRTNNSASLFHVTGTGSVYINGSLHSSSDVSLKSDIESIPNSLDKVLQLRGVSYVLNPPKEEQAVSPEEEYKRAKERTPLLTPEIWGQIQEEKTRKQLGVIAQEVEKVLPEVVRTREDGLKSVAYQEMIGLLIEAIKEQENKIEQLNMEVTVLKGESTVGNFRSSTGISGLAQQCVLSQNAPNPFSDLTEIKYFVASGVKEAYICVFDMQGKMLQKLNVVAGQSSVTIQGSTLQAGMYLYSLVADGQEVDTKRMILTK